MLVVAVDKKEIRQYMYRFLGFKNSSLTWSCAWNGDIWGTKGTL